MQYFQEKLPKTASAANLPSRDRRMESDSRNDHALRLLRRALGRHRRKGLLVFATILACAVAASAIVPRTYRSEAKMLVRLGRADTMLDPTASAGSEPVASVPRLRDAEVNSLAEILGSRALAEKVVDAIGPAAILETEGTGDASEPEEDRGDGEATWLNRAAVIAEPAMERLRGWTEGLRPGAGLDDRERAVLELQHNLSVEVGRQTNLVSLSYEACSPETARKVAARVVEVYLDEHTRVYRTRGSEESLAEQLDHKRRELTAAEDALRGFKERTGLVAPVGQRDLLVARQGRLGDELLQAEGELAATESKIRRLEEMLRQYPDRPEISRGDEGTDEIRSRLRALQLQQKEAAARYTADHPQMQEINRQLAEAQQVLPQKRREGQDAASGPRRVREELLSALSALEPQRSGLQSRQQALRAQLAAVDRELKAFNEHQQQLVGLEREADLKEAGYRRYAQGLDQARFDQALQSSRLPDIQVVQPATLEPKPVRPRTAIHLALGLVGALLGALAVMVGCESLDHSLRNEEDIEQRLAIPVLASIPRFRSKQLGLHHGKR